MPLDDRPRALVAGRLAGAGAAALAVARVPDHDVELHRAGHAGDAWPRRHDGRGRHRFVRPAGIRRHRRLRHRGAHGAGRRIALARAGRQPAAGRCLRGADRLGHAAPVGALPVARHHRLGHRDLLPVRQPAPARPVQRHRQCAGNFSGGLGLRQRPQVLPADLDRRIGRAGGGAEPARLALRTRHSRAALSRRDGRKLRRRHRGIEAGRVHPGGPAGRRRRLAARAFPALRQPACLRRQCRHRLPLHGRHRRRQQRLGRAGRRVDHDGGQGVAEGPVAPAVPAHGQLRDHRVRRADDPAAAPHARGTGAGAGALVAGAGGWRALRAAQRRWTPRRCRGASGRRPARRCWK